MKIDDSRDSPGQWMSRSHWWCAWCCCCCWCCYHILLLLLALRVSCWLGNGEARHWAKPFILIRRALPWERQAVAVKPESPGNLSQPTNDANLSHPLSRRREKRGLMLKRDRNATRNPFQIVSRGIGHDRTLDRIRRFLEWSRRRQRKMAIENKTKQKNTFEGEKSSCPKIYLYIATRNEKSIYHQFI